MTISRLKADLEASLHGTTLNQITGLDNLINRAARQLLLDCDPAETRRIAQFTNPIYDKVFDYVVPDDLKGTKIIDIRPQVGRGLTDRYVHLYNQDFDVGKDFTTQPNFTIQHNTGVKTIRIDATNVTTGALIDQAQSITANGLWSVAVNASDLREDNLQFITGTQSLAFDLANTGVAGSIGTISNATLTPQDLSNYEDNGAIFFYMYFPTGADITSVEVRWGSGAGDYWTSTQTTTFFGLAFQNGWNLLKADWGTATKVNLPVVTAVNYLDFIITYDGSLQTAVRLNNVIAKLGKLMEIEYYSKFIFRDATTGAFQEEVSDVSNLVNLDTESYNLLFYQVACLAAQQQQGLSAGFDNNFFQKRYNEALFKYMATNKSEWQKPKATYYTMPNQSMRKYFGRGYNY